MSLIYDHNEDDVNTKETIEAAKGQKVSEVSVEPTQDGKPPYKRSIKTEADTVRELKGESPITINTEADPDYSDTEETEDSEEKTVD